MRRLVSLSLIAAGVALLGDAALTVVWQEPLSAVRADVDQRRLKRALGTLAVAPPPRAEPVVAPLRRRAIAGAARALGARAGRGQPVAVLRAAAIDLDVAVVMGSRLDLLRRGPGFIDGTPLPGRPGSAAIAGHRTTYGAPFRRLDDLRRGDVVSVALPYATFVYAVADTRIVGPRDVSVLARAGDDRLVLSACHPLFSAARRIVVVARLVSVGQPARSLKRDGVFVR